MATPPPNQNPTRINAPLNFRHTDTLTTTKVPHYPTKLTTGMSIIPGWNRPNANGQNANINDKDYNGPDFKPRPLKHWRRQLRVYDYKGGANNSRAAAISQLDRPGLTVYHFKPDCACVPGEGGNSYIISNNKFGYETKDDNYSKAGSDVQIQNNGFSVVPYNATEAQINDTTNAAYKVATGVYNTNCINCSPQGNLIKSGIAFQSQAFFSYSNDKLETRCQTYGQNISMTKAPGCVYFDAQGIPLWPNNLRNGPQVVAPINYEPTRLYNKPCLSETIYKPNNIGFGRQGAVSGSTRLKKLVSDTMTMNGSSFYSAKGAQEANLGKYQGTNVAGNYYVKTKKVINSCLGTVPGKPILSVIDIDINSITFSWEDTGSTLCKVSYYNLTYYAIQILGTVRELTYDNNYNNHDNYDNYNNYNNYNNKQFITSSKDIPFTNTIPIFDDTIYQDLDNNVKYKIISQINTNTVTPDITDTFALTYTLTGLTTNTVYVAYINGINGNGAGETSDKVLTETLLNPNLLLNIAPPYSYEYNNIPQILSGYATSDTQSENSDNIIRTSISYDTNAIYKNVAIIYNNNNSKNTFKILLQNAGYFNIYALQTKFGNYGASSVLSIPIEIKKSKPTINFTTTTLNTQPIIYGVSYNLSDAIIGNVNNNKKDGKNILFDYKTSDSKIAYIQTNINTNIKSLYITGMGTFNIVINAILNSQLSQNYDTPTPFRSNPFTVQKSTPSILQNTKFIPSGTYGTPYTFYPPSINYTPKKQPPGSIAQTLLYSIKNSSPAGIASIDASGNVTINGAGTFNIYAYCNSTSFYNDNYLLSSTITIDPQTPVISFSPSLSAKYDVPYILVQGTINNKDQTLSYDIVNSVPANNVVNISTIYDNTGTNSGKVQYSPSQSNNLQKISYGIIKPTSEGFLNSISFQQLNANIPTSYYIVSVQSVSHNVSINSTYSTYSNPYAMSSTFASPNPTYPPFPSFSTGILSTIVDDVYINNISIALAYPTSVGITNYSFACDLFVKDTITKKPVNLTNNPLNVIELPGSTPGGSLYMYNISCNVILTETQLATATLIIKSGSNASYYPSITTGNMFITVNYISILTSKCSLVSIPANVTTPQNFDLTDFSVLMNPAHPYTISLWLLGNITQNISGYDIYSRNGTVCATNGSTPYIYGTILQGIPVTRITDITKPLYFNRHGTFFIKASCISTNNYYGNSVTSKQVVIGREVPTITFSQNLNTTGVYNISFVLPMPLATVNNNIQNISYLTVSPDNDDIPSTVATINSDGTELLINSVGTFRIKASVIETANLDFSKKHASSNIITINKGTPSIIFDPTTFQTSATYLKNSTFQIVGVSTTNTDTPGPILSYSSSDPKVATISGTTVNIISAGNFFIYVSCPSTNNFNGLTGTTSVKSLQITINKATPTLSYPPGFGIGLTVTNPTTYSYPYIYSLTGITSNNTDNSSITFTLASMSPAKIAAITDGADGDKNITIYYTGQFTFQASSSKTNNFNTGYSNPITIIINPAKPIITFPKISSRHLTYGGGPFIFTPATIKNNDVSQKIIYNIVTTYSPNSSITSIANFQDPTKPSVTITSVGKFYITATCTNSTNTNYIQPIPVNSNIINVGIKTPSITFSSSLQSSIPYTNLNYKLPNPIATVNNGVQTQSLFTYKAVNMDDDDPSDVASISSDNTYLIINKVGKFRIYVYVDSSENHDYSSNEAYYNIDIIPAKPSFPLTLVIRSSLVYNEKYTIPNPKTSNTDPNPAFSYSIINKDNSNIASVSETSVTGTTVKIIGVGQFQISVTIASTTNYINATQIYPSPSTYYKSIKATPVITFPQTTAKSAIFGSPYTFTGASISNYDPLTQPITYSIYPTPPFKNVASIKYIKGSPYVTINSVGKFQIQASCPMSTNGFYNSVPLSSKILSDIITIIKDTPTVTFNTNNFSSSYEYVYNIPSSLSPYTYLLTAPIASINPSNTTQTLKYSIVNYNSTSSNIIPSNIIATISSDGTSLNTNSSGKFKIYAEAAESISLDYGKCNSLSNTITITPATPIIRSFSALSPPPSWVYDVSYNIPYPTTSNTDATSAQIVSYSTDYPDIISISGTSIRIIGVGNFNIKVTIAATPNYISPPSFIYPLTSPYYYTSIKATPVITFTQTTVKSAKFGSPYSFTAATIKNNDSSQTITYSIISIYPPNTTVASFSDPKNPASITILSGGQFQIQASCTASSNGYYNGATQLLPAPTASPSYITVAKEVPNIVFNTNNFNTSYTYSKLPQLTSPPPLPTSSTIASITPNPGGQILKYYAVEAVNSYTLSTVATISSDGKSLTTKSVGSFNILVKTEAVGLGLDYGANHKFSNTITINKATPIIQSFSALSPPPSWVYSSITPQKYTIPYPLTSNTDSTSDKIVSYSILTPTNTTIATVSGNTITSTGVGKFQISVTIAATPNYISPPPFIYPSPSTYYTFIATPIITFNQTTVKSATFGSPYTSFTGASISNNDPSQTITYSIISIYPPNTTVASFSDPTNPASITILSGGQFQIQASCIPTNYYMGATQLLPAPTASPSYITVANEIPNIVFNTNNFNTSYTYSTLPQLTSPPPLPTSSTIASITPNPGGQILKYYAVEVDSDKLSPVATIISNGTYLTTNSVGSFRICAQTAAIGLGLKYGTNHKFSNTITITKATPIIQSFSALSPPPSWVYDVSYNIPYPTTSNTDATSAQIVSYSTDYPDIISISGTSIKIIGVGNFNIKVTIAATKNYISPPPFIYPLTSPYYYTSNQATPVITFNQKTVKSATFGSPYSFTGASISNNDPSQTITYSIISISPPNTDVASFSDPTNPASITILSGGQFQIQASCTASSNGYYNGATQLLPLSPPYITVANEIPNIVFNTNNFNTSYLYAYSNALIPTPYTFTSLSSIASITPNLGGQILTYSAVEVYSDTPSPFATISSIGTGASQIISLTTNSVGTFRIYAQTAAMGLGLDYGANNEFSNTITITPATPIIRSFSALSPPLSWVYDVSYNIPYPTTSNTDATSAQIVSYSTDYPDIISISGTSIKIIGVGNFNIKVTIAATTNYISPPPFIYSYTSIQATPVITFNQTTVKSAIFGSPYTSFTGASISNSDPSQTITYSIISISPPNTDVASFSDPTNPASITINSYGTFQIQASCTASSNGYYNGATKLLPLSPPYIQVSSEVPNIVFNTNNFNSQYTYQQTPSYTLSSSTSPLASITNNTVQTLTYSAVEVDSDTLSPFATISSIGTGASQIISLTTNSVGSFRICAQTAASIGLDYAAWNEFSNTITINKATPTFPSTLAIPSAWVYSSITLQKYTIPNPLTSNTDPNPKFSYSILTPTNTTIATVLGNTITSTDVGQFQISVTIAATTNYTQASQIYPLPPTPTSPPSYYTFIATPVITFNQTTVKSATFGSPYTFTGASISNNDPSQTITYSIISIPPPNTDVASFSDPTNPASITILSGGQFQIQASCSPTNYYTGATQLLPAPTASPSYITVANEIPNIVFNTKNFNTSYTYSTLPQLTSPPPLPTSSTIASITPNPGGQILTYSIVDASSNVMINGVMSQVATISSDGTILTTISVGSFRIFVETAAIGLGLDYGANNAFSNTITITPATPTITSTLSIPSSWIYDVSYNIPYPTTSNNDSTSAQIVSYSTDNPDIISISGTVISVTGVGNFQILVTIAPTTNFSAVTYSYPSGLVYPPPPGVTYASYKAGQATPDITFNVDQSATYDTSYNFVPVRFITGDPLTQNVTYSIQ